MIRARLDTIYSVYSVTSAKCIPWFVLLLVCASPASFGQRVTIRVVNANERPFRNKQVYVLGLRGQVFSGKEANLMLNAKPVRSFQCLLENVTRPGVSNSAAC